jgi:hypothetical protein|tara:strand:- start:119 stop:355 length:237 start_codon:yes stop_codon:yes gene_type:complete
MANAVTELTPNELPEWAAWNKDNWLIIANEYAENRDSIDCAGVFDFSVWMWSNYPQRVEYLADTNPRNYDELMLILDE